MRRRVWPTPDPSRAKTMRGEAGETGTVGQRRCRLDRGPYQSRPAGLPAREPKGYVPEMSPPVRCPTPPEERRRNTPAEEDRAGPASTPLGNHQPARECGPAARGEPPGRRGASSTIK